MGIGIDDMALYVPKLYLDIKTLAEKRDIPYDKLSKGLGLHKMAICDVHEDAATMAAEVIIELIERNHLDPRQIGRIYLGTESALDSAKPTATYAVEMAQSHFSDRWGPDCFRQCDVLDMTFACIGAVDALQNTLDWVACDPQNVGIVIASDIAKYELHSSGEYTQGAGAVAVLVKANPRLLAFRRIFGVATESVHDFFKPRREKFVETPIFDGHYSNQCYQNRMTEALAHFKEKAIEKKLFKEGQFPGISDRWARMIFHLPYAFHAKRMYVEQFTLERKEKGLWERDVAKYGYPRLETMRFADEKSFQKAYAGLLKMVSESTEYQRFVNSKLEKAQKASQEVGNLYTASIFLALMSSLENDFWEHCQLHKKRIGFVAYGSGSKAKVFEAQVQYDWQQVVRHFSVGKKLKERKSITYEQYERLHMGAQKTSVLKEKGNWALNKIGNEGVTLGARYYHKH